MQLHFQKTTLCSAALLLCLNHGLVPAHASDNTNFNGIYLGGSVGGLAATADFETSNQYTAFYGGPPAGVESESGSSTTEKSAFVAGHLGYGTAVFDWPLWLGAEFFVKSLDADLNTKSEGGLILPLNISTAISFDDIEFGVDFRPGLLISPTTLIYARIGAAFNTLDLQSTVLTPASEIPSASFGNSEQVTALRLGAGLEQKLGCHFTVSADYLYTDYGNISASGSESYPDLGYPLFFQGASEVNNIHTHAFMLGLSYYPMIKDCNGAR